MEKRSNLILLVYLILALIGSSAISVGEAFYFEQSISDNMGSGRYYSSENHNIDWLAGATIRKANSYSNSLLRNSLFRAFSFAGIFVIAMYLEVASLKTINNDNAPTIKNLISLKLRI
ncbi:hypothetical protein R84B8_00337 [Treponema sp. R8-4-B8]